MGKQRLLWICALLSLAVAEASAFSEKDIVSPVAGVWHNVQPLVLGVEEGTEIYYSLTGSDPLRSGFAYDGPVVIPQWGKVSLRITALGSGGERADFTVDYEVRDMPFDGSDESSAFVRTLQSNPIRKYVSGSVFAVPPEFSYTIGGMERGFAGRELSLSFRNTVERYVPMLVGDDSHRYRFVLHVMAASNGSVRQKQLPFVIENWNLLTFATSAYSYRLDGGEWSNEPATILIDRLSQHTVFWKPAQSPGDAEASSYTLPPVPRLLSRTEGNGAVTFTLQPAPFSSAQYKLGAVPRSLGLESVAGGLYDSVTIDAFYGEDLTKDFVAGVYYDGLFQGTLSTAYSVDRLPPEPPAISSSSQKVVSHNQTSLIVKSEPEASIYVAVSSPLEFDEGSEEAVQESFESLQTGDYRLYREGEVVLSSVSDKATFYKIRSYAVDRAGNQSAVSEYRLVVDEHNFYLNPRTARGGEPDGSFSNPFATLEQAVYALNGTKDMRLHIMGRVEVPEGVVLRTSCTILGNQSLLSFADNAGLVIEDADVLLRGCILTKKSGGAGDGGLVWIRGGSLSLESCQLSAFFAVQGTLIRGDGTELRLVDTALTSHAAAYTCNVCAVSSKFTALRSRAIAVARTSVNFSLAATACAVSQTVHTVSGHIGRCLEVSRGTLDMKGNTFTGSFDLPPAAKARRPLEAVWKDADTLVRADADNTIYGF